MKSALFGTWGGARGGRLGAAVFLLAIVLWLVNPGNLIQRLTVFPPWATASMLLLLVGNLFLVSFRFWRVLAHFGIHVPWNVASRASVAGHVAGLVVISLFGQVAGRQAVLESHGVPVLVNSSLSVYERGLLALSSGTLCVLGGIFLLGQPVVTEFTSTISLIEIALAGAMAAAFSYCFGHSSFEAETVGRLWSRHNVERVTEILGITAAGQILVLACFVIGIHAVAPGIGVARMLAAAAIISFAASMPITVNGWGVRELASVFVLGQLGVPAADAVTVSIMVGLCSTLVIVCFIPFSLQTSQIVRPARAGHPRVHEVFEIERTSAWMLSMAVAVAVFFQAHVSLPGGIVNVNLADPLAILALAALGTRAILSGRMPAWRAPRFNLALGIISLTLCLGFLRGWIEIGVTQWALGGRLFGWLVLLGYVAAGYFLVAYFGARGLRRFSETIAATAVAIVLVQGVLRLTGLAMNPTQNFEGFAGNRNAFAFQLLTVTSFLLVYTSTYARKLRHDTAAKRGTLIVCLLATTFVGLIWAGSRAGWGVGAMLILGSWWWRLADRRLLVSGLVLAILLWIGILTLSQLGSAQGTALQSSIYSEVSDHERWRSYVHALELWRESPLLGAGLGVFIARSPAWFGSPLVVHSTPLWILAEFGLLGIIAFGGAFLMLLHHAFRVRRRLPANRILQLLLLGFAAFSLVHDVLYQRIFWLALGVLLARTSAEERPEP